GRLARPVSSPDVVVVGGGLVGLSAAHRLACHGAAVTVVDPGAAGAATAAGAGIISPGSRWPPSDVVLPLVKAAIGFYPQLLAALAAACGLRGVAFIDRPAVIERRRNRVGVEAGGTTWSGIVILAAGAWSGDLAAGAGVELPVYHQRGQIAHLELPGTDTSRWPMALGFHSHYLVSFPHARVVAGATRERAGEI